ncbi:MAG: histidine--tRNA ligase [bacterium]|nr:MAG: histidine--tRNA ligase [bacterium]
MSQKIKPRIYKGTRDFLPEQMIKRQFVINHIERIFKKYGFEALETPTMELWETLSGKYGEEADRLTYRFTDRGDREVGLRYDLTVPLSRVVASYPHIPKPFKRYQIQPVWRADKPQKGRFREFYQCDIDVIGSASMLAEAEILAAIYEILKVLGFDQFLMRINSRKILRGIAEVSGISPEQEGTMARAIDKFDKIGLEGVKSELIKSGINAAKTKALLEKLGSSGTNSQRITDAEKYLKESDTGIQGLEELKKLFHFLQIYEIPEEYLIFDLFLARGLDYYTGPIFETFVREPQIGSITGGGRYDNLIGMFSGTDYPATGCSIGLERIITVMEELDMFPEYLKTPIQALVTVFEASTLDYSIDIARKLRAAHINTELYTGESKLRGQFGLANDKSIPLVIIAGPDEIENQQFNLKNMRTGEQSTHLLEDLIMRVQEILNTLHSE